MESSGCFGRGVSGGKAGAGDIMARLQYKDTEGQSQIIESGIHFRGRDCRLRYV